MASGDNSDFSQLVNRIFHGTDCLEQWIGVANQTRPDRSLEELADVLMTLPSIQLMLTIYLVRFCCLRLFDCDRNHWDDDDDDGNYIDCIDSMMIVILVTVILMV